MKKEKGLAGGKTMKNYEKPKIKDIDVKLFDIIAISCVEGNSSNSDGDSFSIGDLFPKA